MRYMVLDGFVILAAALYLILCIVSMIGNCVLTFVRQEPSSSRYVTHHLLTFHSFLCSTLSPSFHLHIPFLIRSLPPSPPYVLNSPLPSTHYTFKLILPSSQQCTLTMCNSRLTLCHYFPLSSSSFLSIFPHIINFLSSLRPQTHTHPLTTHLYSFSVSLPYHHCTLKIPPLPSTLPLLPLLTPGYL